ncbi:MAG: DUF1320 domain-containing protein [Thermodesulfovibrionales bacterium]|nr:DUF1320 domain-containing protein [Thermodesulfovibrionales bacterium]
MAYSTIDDIKKLIPEKLLVLLTDDENLGLPSQSRVDEAIAQADAEINSYCGERYAVPFAGAPDIVKKLSIDIAVYNLFSRRAAEMPPLRAERYGNAVRILGDISRGVVSLGIDPSPQASSEGRAETNKETDGNVFSREKLEGF